MQPQDSWIRDTIPRQGCRHRCDVFSHGSRLAVMAVPKACPVRPLTPAWCRCTNRPRWTTKPSWCDTRCADTRHPRVSCGGESSSEEGVVRIRGGVVELIWFEVTRTPCRVLCYVRGLSRTRCDVCRTRCRGNVARRVRFDFAVFCFCGISRRVFTFNFSRDESAVLLLNSNASPEYAPGLL